MAAPIGRAAFGYSVRLLRHRHAFWNIGRHRLLLTSEYKCDDEWKRRLQNPLMQKVDIDNFVVRVQEKFDKEGTASAIDMDIIANKLDCLDPVKLDFAQNIFYRFRHSRDAVNVRDSMCHGLLRNLLQMKETDRLMNILRDKIHYGIFLDTFSANILLDYFIEQKLFKDAAEVAIDLMLQETQFEPLCHALSWYACRLRVQELLTEPATQTESVAAADDGELMYRRVAFIENPWYDDHFDIATERQQLGKTLTVLTSAGGDELSRADQLLGWALYEKLDNVTKLLHTWINDSTLTSALSLSQVDRVRSVLESIVTGEVPPVKEVGLRTVSDLVPVVTEAQMTQSLAEFTECVEKLKSAGKLSASSDTDLSTLRQRVIDSQSAVSATDCSRLTDMYRQWLDERQQLVDKQLQDAAVNVKKQEIAQRLLELKAREEKLRFFDEQTKLELKITELPADWDRVVSDEVSEEQFVAPPGERRGEAPKRGK